MNEYLIGGFLDELEKVAWRGTYYHGTTPIAEAAILGGEGLRASLGGTKPDPLVAYAQELMDSEHPSVKKYMREAKGKTTLSKSKTLAKIYGTAATRLEDRHSAARLKGLIRQFIEYQPLEISGETLAGLAKDPSHRLLGVQTAKDIPAHLIRKAQPSKIGRLAIRLLARK